MKIFLSMEQTNLATFMASILMLKAIKLKELKKTILIVIIFIVHGLLIKKFLKKLKKSCVDSDRLFQYNPNKYNSSCRSVFDDIRQDFNHRSPESIEEFLRLYYEDNSIILYEIKECCNVSNGFPVWSFMFAIES